MNQHLPARLKRATTRTAGRTGAAVLALAVTLATSAPVAAQDLHSSRRPSPVGIAKALMGDTYVKVTYGRPYMRGRAIFGGAGESTTYLVPFGEVWRTGANEATELTTTGPLWIEGMRLEAGTYSIFSVPGETSWSIHFSPELGLDGTNRMDEATGQFLPAFDPEDDVLRVEVPSHTSEEVVDQFTIELERTPQGADLVFSWERTEVRVSLHLADTSSN
jgi:hypothetical protein